MPLLNLFRKSKKQKIAIRKNITQSSLQYLNSITNKVPAEAIPYCLELWKNDPFLFRISKTRSTCLGNYHFKNKQHYISINEDLNPYNFLITLIHEIAHQHVFIDNFKSRLRPKPHGDVWKLTFKALLLPLMKETVFPEGILSLLRIHMKNPAASSTRDPNLMKALKRYDFHKTLDEIHLEDIGIDQHFVFKNREFKKIKTRRTRALCEELGSKRRYTIPLLAEVKEL